MRRGFLVSWPSRLLVTVAAALLCMPYVSGSALASPTTAEGLAKGNVDCGNVVGPRWIATWGPTTGKHYTVTAKNVSCNKALSNFRQIVGRISPGPDATGFWSPRPGVWCIAPPKGKPFSIGSCTFGTGPTLPRPGVNPGSVKSFEWHLCIALAHKDRECKFRYIK
jgi:hypothetical protein